MKKENKHENKHQNKQRLDQMQTWEELASHQDGESRLGGQEYQEYSETVERLNRYTIEAPQETTGELAARLSRMWSVEAEEVGAESSISPSAVPAASVEAETNWETGVLPSYMEQRGSKETSMLGFVMRRLHPKQQVFRLSFWIASVVIYLLAGLLGALDTQGGTLQPIVFAAPLLAAMSVGYAFRSYGKPMFELELSMPISPTQLIFGRLTWVLLYNIAIAFLMTCLLHGFSKELGLYIVNWLIPLGVASFTALTGMLYFGLHSGLLASLGVWSIQLILNQYLGVFYIFNSDQFSGSWLTSKLVGSAVIVVLFLMAWQKTRRISTPGALM